MVHYATRKDLNIKKEKRVSLFTRKLKYYSKCNIKRSVNVPASEKKE